MKSLKIKSIYYRVIFLCGFITLTSVYTHPASAISAFPSKAHICASILREVVLTDRMQLNDSAYTLNSAKALQTALRVGEVGANNSQGLFLSSTVGKSARARRAAAGRLEGIYQFSRVRDVDDSGELNRTIALTLRGHENIHNFFLELKTLLETADSEFQEKYFRVYGKSALVGAALTASLGSLAISKSMNDGVFNLDDVWSALGMFFILSANIDFLTRPILQWDYSFLNQLNKIEEIINGEESWGLLSRNFQFDPVLIKAIERNPADQERYSSVLETQSFYDTINPLFIFIKNTYSQHLKNKNSWVGVDILAEANASGEPELHIIIRNSDKRPVYPSNKKKNRSALTIRSATPDWQTESTPVVIPIPVPADDDDRRR